MKSDLGEALGSLGCSYGDPRPRGPASRGRAPDCDRIHCRCGQPPTSWSFVVVALGD